MVCSQMQNQEDKELRILSTVAEILQKKIRLIACDNNHYPESD